MRKRKKTHTHTLTQYALLFRLFHACIVHGAAQSEAQINLQNHIARHRSTNHHLENHHENKYVCTCIHIFMYKIYTQNRGAICRCRLPANIFFTLHLLSNSFPILFLRFYLFVAFILLPRLPCFPSFIGIM